jgi:hypothetical protein
MPVRPTGMSGTKAECWNLYLDRFRRQYEYTSNGGYVLSLSYSLVVSHQRFHIFKKAVQIDIV